MSETVAPDLRALTAEIIAAHLSGNPMTPDAVPSLIEGVYRALATVGQVQAIPAVAVPAVPIEKSVFPAYLVCLEDGRQLKMLKRHFRTSYGMTPADYRAKWGLPPTYPMVAPDYAAQRSDLTKEIGLGRSKMATAAEPAVTKLRARRAKGSRG